jgi:hypothetical protein
VAARAFVLTFQPADVSQGGAAPPPRVRVRMIRINLRVLVQLLVLMLIVYQVLMLALDIWAML